MRYLIIFFLRRFYSNISIYNNCIIFNDRNSIIKNSLNQIHDKYPEIAELICYQKWVIFHIDKIKKTILSSKYSIIGITEDWTCWGNEGVIAYIIYACYLKQTRNEFGNISRESAMLKARNKTLDFLDKNSFPNEIKSSYRDGWPVKTVGHF